jgi:hypothetical protein
MKLEVIDLLDLMEVKGGGGPASPIIVICAHGASAVTCTAQGSGIVRRD